MALLRQPDAPRLERWFQRRFPHARDLRLTKMHRAFPGLSRETWFVDATWQAEGREQGARYVLRTQLPGNVSLAPRSLEYEAKVYQALSRSTLPVPPYVAYESAPEWLIDGERPFFVRGWVAGALQPLHVADPDPRHDGLRIEVAKELIAKLADVHRLDWRALGFGEFMTVPETPGAVPLSILNELYEDVLGSGAGAQPALVEAVLSLREALPEAPPRITLVKENCGLGDEVWDEQQPIIRALCDWEGARLGDPAADIAIAMRSTGWCWSLEGMLGHYESLTGERISTRRVEFYAALFKVSEFAVLQGRALRFLRDGIDRRVQLLSISQFPYIAMPALARTAGF